MRLGEGPLTECQAGAADSGFDAGGDYKRQRAFIVDSDAGVLDAEFVENVARLFQNCVAIIRSDAGFESNLDPAGVANFKGDVDVGANFFAPMAGFGGSRRSFECGHKES